MLTVAILVFGAKLVAAAKEMAVAWRYGTGVEVDAYLLAFTIVTWIPSMVIGVGTVIFVPRLVALALDVPQRSRFVPELNGTFLLLGVVITLLSLAIGPWLVELIAGNLAIEARQQTRATVIQLSPLALLIVVSGLCAFRLQARERQGYTFLEAMPSLGVLIFVLLAPPAAGIGPLVAGTLAGGLLQVVWSFAMLRRADGGLGGLAFAHVSPQWRLVYGAFGVMALGQLAMGFSNPIDQYYATRVGDGAVATLGYANRIVFLATGLGAVAIARALLPVVSEAAARGDFWLGRSQTIRWSGLMLGAGGLSLMLGWALAPWMVELLFQRGAFGVDDTERVSRVLRIGLLQLPFFFSGIVLVQWIVALGRYHYLFYLSAVVVTVKVVLNELLIDLLGLDALMYSTAAMYALSWASHMLIVRASGARGE